MQILFSGTRTVNFFPGDSPDVQTSQDLFTEGAKDVEFLADEAGGAAKPS